MIIVLFKLYGQKAMLHNFIRVNDEGKILKARFLIDIGAKAQSLLAGSGTQRGLRMPLGWRRLKYKYSS